MAEAAAVAEDDAKEAAEDVVDDIKDHTDNA